MSEHRQSFSFNTLPSDEIFDFPGMNEIAKQNNGNLAALSEIQAQDANCDRNNVSESLGGNSLPASFDSSAAKTRNAGQDQGPGLDLAIDWQGWFSRSDSFDPLGQCDPLPQQPWQDMIASQRTESFDSIHPSSLVGDITTNDMNISYSSDSMSPLSLVKEPAPASQQQQANFERRDSSPTPVKLSGLEWRRAKNRTAASKCRAKQKVHHKALQKEFEQGSAQNAHLKRHERKLRELVTYLRDLALQHDKTRCRCKSLHNFNMRRAEEISQGIVSIGSSSKRS